MSGRIDAEQAARYLRQQEELGMGALVLDGMTRAEALARAETGRTGARRVAGPARPAPRSGDLRTRPAAPDPSSVGDATAVLELPGEHEALRELALACTRCALAEGRTRVVFADGNPRARLMVVGEAPGANEDATGLPFVGAAGKLLDLLLASVGFSREETAYIANVIKCRPPGNRNPLPAEIEACSPFLKRQIELVRPEALLAVGTFSGQLLTGKDLPLGKLRGEVYGYQGIPLVVTYHPAALLRNSGWTGPTWDDLQLLRGVMDGA
jgi:uracil-DNA glycosylase